MGWKRPWNPLYGFLFCRKPIGDLKRPFVINEDSARDQNAKHNWRGRKLKQATPPGRKKMPLPEQRNAGNGFFEGVIISVNIDVNIIRITSFKNRGAARYFAQACWRVDCEKIFLSPLKLFAILRLCQASRRRIIARRHKIAQWANYIFNLLIFDTNAAAVMFWRLFWVPKIRRDKQRSPPWHKNSGKLMKYWLWILGDTYLTLISVFMLKQCPKKMWIYL